MEKNRPKKKITGTKAAPDRSKRRGTETPNSLSYLLMIF